MCGQMVAGRPPFRGSHDYGTFQKVLAGDYSFPDAFPSLPADLVAKLLVWKDP
jgi:3-phosphoinositide dependent protein kinase-1